MGLISASEHFKARATARPPLSTVGRRLTSRSKIRPTKFTDFSGSTYGLVRAMVTPVMAERLIVENQPPFGTAGCFANWKASCTED